MYSEPAAPPVDPYSDAYNAPPATAAAPTNATDGRDPPRGRSRSRSPPRSPGYRSPTFRGSKRGTPPPRRPPHAPIAPNPSSVLGVFGLSIRTTERDLDEEFTRFGHVEKVTIVYDQRSDRSRGFGFIRMSTVEEASKCINELNGIDLNGRRIRVDYSVTDRPHAPTPGEYMGHRRSSHRDSYYGRDSRDYRDRDHRDYREGRDRDRGRGNSGFDKDRERDPYGRDSRDRDRDWRRSPPRRHSPDYRKRRSYSRSPPRGSSPTRAARDFDGANDTTRW
ncbi:hypothetical protein F5888DRAFT_438675 [Russula emetica]|nr:hypothetical protein F5888DRAFT_438675 [Russula emetica]